METLRWFLTYKSVDEIQWYSMTIQMKLLQQYFYMVLFKFKCFAKWRVRFVLNFHLGIFGIKRFKFHLSHWIFVCLLFAVVWIYQHCNLQLLDIAWGWICYRSETLCPYLFLAHMSCVCGRWFLCLCKIKWESSTCCSHHGFLAHDQMVKQWTGNMYVI